MASLAEQFQAPEQRDALVRDALEVLDAEVADKGGISGVAIKGAYSIVKGIKPGFIEDVVRGLLDPFLGALDPLYQEGVASGKAPGSHLQANGERMAEALLAITDARAERSAHTAIRKTYGKLRPGAKKHVSAAAPRLGTMLDRHLQG